MNSWTIRQRLTLAFTLLVLTGLAVSLAGLRALGQANARFESHVHGTAEREHLAADVRVLANRRAIGVRDMAVASTDAARDHAREMAVQANTALQQQLASLRRAVDAAPEVGSRERERLGALVGIESRYETVAMQIVELATNGRRDEAIRRINDDCRPLLEALLTASREYVVGLRSEARAGVAASMAAYADQRAWMLAAALASALLAAGLGWSIARFLSRALGAEPAALRHGAGRIAAGDLGPVEGAEDAPAGSVLASMASMQQQLVALIAQVRTSSEQIAAASSQIAQANADLSSRTEQQAAALQQTAASMDELDSTVRQNAEHAGECDRLARDASGIASRGGEVVADVVRTMRDIDDGSRRIVDIIATIDGIAFQTNILALNAAVESARAGEQGRGFAVVAAEVRALAQRSAGAAQQIKALIGDSVARAGEGASLADQAGRTMDEVVSAIRRVTGVVGEISTASAEQSGGVRQVGDAVTQMDQVTQRNAALVEEGAAAAQSLSEQAQQLAGIVRRFRLPAGAHALGA